MYLRAGEPGWISPETAGDAGVRRANWMFAIALVGWIGCFLVVRAVALARGGSTMPWDVGWYIHIALKGYHFAGDIMTQEPVAFLPLFPMSVRALMSIGMPPSIAVVVLCVCSAATGMLLLYRGLSARLGATWSALACALFMAAPFSMYFLDGYSEALYFLFFGAFWWALLRRKNFVLAALLAGFATGVRPFGVILALVWAVALCLEVRDGRLSRSSAIRTFLLFGPLTILGILAVSLFYYREFGDLFLYRNALLAWSQDLVQGLPRSTAMPFDVSLNGVFELFRVSADAPLALPATIARLLLWAFVLLLPFVLRRLPPEALTYGIGLLLFCIATSAGYAIGRHMATNMVLPMAALALIWRVRDVREGSVPPGKWRMTLVGLLFVAGMSLQAYLLTLFFHRNWVS